MKLALVLTLALLLDGQERRVEPGSLALEDIIALAKSGQSEELVVTQIKRNAKPFNLNANEIVELKKSGVSETVIKFLLDPTLPYTPPPPPAPPAPPVVAPVAPPAPPSAPPAPPPPPPKDPLALKVPPEPGIYYLAPRNEFQRLDYTSVVPYKQPGKVKPMISGGLLKGHVVGSVVGADAKIKALKGPVVFYARLMGKSPPDDLVLLRLDASQSRRDLDFGTKPGKPVFPVSSVRQFESEDVMPGLARITAKLDKPGEYLFFVLGSADDKKGLLGKGYDFASR
jgi:hypothetical protein